MLLLLLALQEVQRIPFPDERLPVFGLAWFAEDKPTLRRLPERLKESFRKPVWDLAQHPSGGRIRFRTDSLKVGLTAQSDPSAMHHMPSVGQNGFDCYVDGEYVNSAWPDAKGKIVKTWDVGSARKLRDITLYLPLYKAASIQEVTLEIGARLESPSPFALPKPVVHYGSSITQGGCASNAGASCQAFVSRWLNVDFVNLGFSGNGMGEPALAAAIAEIDAACYVLDFWGNPSPEAYEAALPPFVDVLRKKRPATPIVVTSPFYFPGEALGGGLAQAQKRKREFARAFVDGRKDPTITFVDGLEMLSREQAAGLVDGIHANTLGFWFNAKGLEPHLRKALGLAK
ncbi:MAG TPA: SGNH/GDSL hydrolase family protein [Planctomycetota bacterium]